MKGKGVTIERPNILALVVQKTTTKVVNPASQETAPVKKTAGEATNEGASKKLITEGQGSSVECTHDVERVTVVGLQLEIKQEAVTKRKRRKVVAEKFGESELSHAAHMAALSRQHQENLAQHRSGQRVRGNQSALDRMAYEASEHDIHEVKILDHEDYLLGIGPYENDPDKEPR